ncbi:MAG TPA: NAD(P)-dependent oxidoreductase [Vicinamibacterales bacterium]|nr:NAD(P)-dependent oxidoreductase [Vicinamibacterales bacterium]
MSLDRNGPETRVKSGATHGPGRGIAEPWRIVMIDPLSDSAQRVFLDQMPGNEFTFECPSTSDPDELLKQVRGAHALLTRRHVVTADLIAAAGPDLRVVQIHGHFPDRVDLEAARRAGVMVAVMPSKGAIAVAEHAMGLMLAFAHKIVPGHRGVVSGAYRERGLQPARTTETEIAFNWLGYPDLFELYEKTLGIVGFGEIGYELARRARSFDMRVLFHTRRPIAEGLVAPLDLRRVPLDELLRESDFVTLHAPHTPQTERLMDAETLSLMKPTAYLINTSRGGLVDEAALVAALREGRLAGAGLDVFSDEPLSDTHPLLALDSVVLTPHVAAGASGGQRVHARESLENVARAFRGEPMRHRLDDVYQSVRLAM